ncbi:MULTISPECIES: DUF1415 domain-containing protein [unclassified Marinobacterium]|jgi:hypothetical protein|uniref:DUF1415 domain-containing protein n=1 Tax=unclassified Marinobacterium TaxID=2644139 RepID=UPI001569E1AE|nr:MULTISPECIES: DUF1415 domain-containing protein [unclassified Marinobacterium]NRP26960.1 hypothetical protein [Marinobacterium sp. xm-d-420]NRP48177.1 hypothetical protein [Marinobacterium sp. xm-d-543]NRP52047.1 hypothetical protein [Marinobacterium sp. xm-v-242]NRP57100.1 hypothetical protein [Marinobacterium sp. xm-d-510]NRP60487.1 hypothetical protein [Marinobacterium sp. xm-d-564]
MTDFENEVIKSTQHWVDKMVVGLNLCPFAKKSIDQNQLRYLVYTGDDIESITQLLVEELERLVNDKSIETTLLIHPNFTKDFDAYLDYLAGVDELIDALGYSGVFQVAGFHPDYQFDGVAEIDPANHTNRSPYPMMHLLREASVAWAVETHPDIDSVPERNVELLREMGEKGIQELISGKR